MVTDIINAIRSNLLVCFPTETVYALACNAMNYNAVEKIYHVKKRDHDKPLSILVNSIDRIMEIANVQEQYIDLINRFSPGPVTYVLSLNNETGLPSKFFKKNVGIRIPDHPIAISILDKLDFPIVATSINISGKKSACTINEIPQTIKQHLSVIIEDDKLVHGMESAVIDLTTDQVRILRKGYVFQS
ncbi:threonylcarbamoyl-AMP synthase [Wolbachia pipientis]|uniref:L-threonylcarbamoyladenylate synthase n=1 Tax=Wolbachia pipientis TaxID=955 RepID=A0A1E7QKD9_WOLPI|nr:L-threonylcarbamoyladenylate synthase [Wolbachia pipientis]OEY86942.1 threonylcarbamoyl-AMP synthase [Wolbachia pipientis]